MACWPPKIDNECGRGGGSDFLVLQLLVFYCFRYAHSAVSILVGTAFGLSLSRRAGSVQFGSVRCASGGGLMDEFFRGRKLPDSGVSLCVLYGLVARARAFPWVFFFHRATLAFGLPLL